VRLVLLVGHTFNAEVQHRYVAARLAAEFPTELVAVVVATGLPQSPVAKARKWLRRYTPAQIVSRTLAQIHRRLSRASEQRHRKLSEILFPDGEDGEMPGGNLVHRVVSHNSAECRELLRRLRPDIVAVYGTLIIGRKLIDSVPKMLNIHTGLSPAYRGSDTIFWALHNSQPEQVGVTVHRVDAGVDSGAILARGRPAIEPGDDEDRLFAKSVQLGADLLCRAIRREFNASAQPLMQDLNSGLEYRSVQRTLAAERRVRKLLRAGLVSEARSQWSEEF